MHPTVELACRLIEQPTISPDPGKCHDILTDRFQSVGADVAALNFGNVENLFAKHGTGSPHICLAGHCDIVPPGPLEAWQTDPYQAVIQDGMIYGRGAADMKGSLAALAIAYCQFVADHPNHQGTVSFLSTSDEETFAIDGTRAALDHLVSSGEVINCGLVGEPTCTSTFGDSIKVGRRGSLTGKMTIHGVQGHVAYPENAKNAIHLVTPFVQELSHKVWDEGSEFFVPTSLQCTSLETPGGVDNMVPGLAHLSFNFRHAPISSAQSLIDRVVSMIESHQIEADLEWHHSALPFQCQDIDHARAFQDIVRRHCQVDPILNTAGGTSDARFFAEHDIPVFEFGPINKTIHAANECVAMSEIEQETAIVYDWLVQVLATS